MAVTIYTYDGISFPSVTPDTFMLLYSRHWDDFSCYKDTTLYSTTDIQLREMTNRIKGTPRGFISSDIEIKKTEGERPY